MIAFREPPPLQVRVRSLEEPAEAPRTFESPLIPWLTGIGLLIVTALIGSQLRRERTQQELLTSALANSLPRQVERGVLAVLPLGTARDAVRDRLADARSTCRAEHGDSVMTCLGAPIVRANTFSRQRVRFAFARGKLSAVQVCPTFVHWSRVAIPAPLAARVAHPAANDCWRDTANLADNEWTYATLPDHAFTTVTVHAADSVRRAGPATAESLVVVW